MHRHRPVLSLLGVFALACSQNGGAEPKAPRPDAMSSPDGLAAPDFDVAVAPADTLFDQATFDSAMATTETNGDSPGPDAGADSAYDTAPASEAGRRLPSLGLGTNYSCAVRSDGNVVCWGSGGGSDATIPPPGTFLQVDGDNDLTCGLRTDGSITCWGVCGPGKLMCNVPTGPFVELAFDHGAGCARRADGRVACWGSSYSGACDVPVDERFAHIAMGGSAACGLRLDGSLLCWNKPLGDGRDNPPAGTYKQLSLGLGLICAIRTDDTILCFGRDWAATSAPKGQFTQVAAGGGIYACAIAADGTPVCWCKQDGYCDLPAGKYAEIVAAVNHACGVRTDGSVVCWGENDYKQATVPASVF